MRSLRTLLAAVAVAAALVPGVASAGIDPPCSGARPVSLQWEDGKPMVVVTPPPYAC
ncbi:MAG TPA: hypothetical protein VFQ85_19510 [Mycobacteriales bacterium]|jgi:ABC-type proline/glycine betaine transport system substrate-binding protein|nr:hypothetical protein [Mycobacteriales bacterium]